jgi:hypothetical protein
MTGAAQMASLVPGTIAIHLVFGIKPSLLDKAFGEAKRHGRVIGPFARFEMERTAADHVGNRSERAGRFEL